MSSNRTYLITGASRGLGKGFTTVLLQKPSTTVIAAVRDPSKESSQALACLPKAADSKLIIVKLDSAIESDAFNAVTSLQQTHGIESLDVVIANAGINHSGNPVMQTSSAATVEHFSINAIAPMTLLQATAALLKASKSGCPAFVALSTIVGSMGSMEFFAQQPKVTSPYGASKAALNWLVRKVHFEEPWLTSFVFHPGVVLTEMTIRAIKEAGVDPKDVGAITVEESVPAMVKIIDSATREISGTFQNYNGTTLPW